MIANTYLQLIGIIIQSAAILFGLIKGLQWYFEMLIKKQELKSKEIIELAKSEVELAKNNMLTSSQVTQILENYHKVIEELEVIKRDIIITKSNDEEKTVQLIKLIDNIEDMVKQQTQNFTEFIMKRASAN